MNFFTKFYQKSFDWLAYSREELKKIEIYCIQDVCGDPTSIIGSNTVTRMSRKMNFAGFGIVLTPHISKYFCPKCGSTRHFKFPFLRFSGYVEATEWNTIGTGAAEVLCHNPKCNYHRMNIIEFHDTRSTYRCPICKDKATVSKNTFLLIDWGGLDINQKEYNK